MRLPLRLISPPLVVCLPALQPLVLEGWSVSSPSGSFDAVHIDPAAQRRIADLSRGEPFLFQLAGERAWLAGDGQVISDEEVVRGWRGAAGEAERHGAWLLLFAGGERALREAMSVLPDDERSATASARQMGKLQAAEIGTTARRLEILRGIISRGTRYSFVGAVALCRGLVVR